MAAQRGQSSPKLVYLRDHAHRARARTPHGARRGAPPPPTDLASEGIWLARSLLLVAGAFALYWLGVLAGTVEPGGDEGWRWTSSHALPHLVLAAGAVLAASSIVRTDPRATLIVGLLAGGLIVLALGGLGRVMVGSDMGDLSLSVRTDVLVQTGALAIGVWAASYAMRAERSATP